ncbi:iron complex transport system substrate-binding protein [Thalassobacillus cyri]|uniref:Iron complex transport system substrate-binding protein n=1 Tax=Thalassobacillus cyri TaxID=571932 RepID=A0A1H3VNN1_9BACI|nr:ABC transporter substrate-binding protein [Thalassobacillus cyri]SDZ76417.1 iron complex transport system substrate-binding protein [Thalassobacillus cyri]
MKTSKTRISFLSFMLAILLAVMVGCGATEEGNESKESPSETNTSEETQGESSAGGFPVTIKDGSGEQVEIKAEPEAIVSVLASNTEIAFALGQGEKMVGVSDYSNYPAETANIEKVGGQEMNVEKILSLNPDMVLVSTFHYENHSDVLQQFKKAGMDVVVVDDANSFEDVYKNIQLVGKATGSSDKADEIVKDMETRLAEVKEKAKKVEEKKKVWVEVAPAPDIFTTGTGTFMHEMLEAINAENVAAEEEGWVKFTEEEAVNLNPEVIITTYGYYVENPEEQVVNREGWSEVPAVENEQVFDVDNDTVTRPGPRLIDGVERLGELIYPEVFGE